MEKPPDKGAKEVAQNHGTTFVPRMRGQEEISWTWKRKPLQGFGHRIGLSYRRKVLVDIDSVLTDIGGKKLLQQFVDGCFGHLLRFTVGVSCGKALHELISHEITVAGAQDDELWFRIGETNIRFAPAEYALVTGLHFGSSSFDPLGSHEMPPEGVFNRLCSGRHITIGELWNKFNQQRLRGSPEDYLKVAHVLALHLMALGRRQNKMVEQWMWVLVDDLDSWNRFPWGAYTYQALMCNVSILPRNRAIHRRYHFFGPVWALQIWAYEAIPWLGDMCAVVTRQVTVPRCLKWSFPSGRKEFPKQFLEQKLDCYVKLEPTDEEKRQPYWLSLQTEKPLGVGYAQGPQGAARRRVESSLGEPGNTVEAPVTDDDSIPKPSPRPSRRRNRTRACICSSLSSGGRRQHVRQLHELLDEAQFDQLLSRLVDRVTEPMVEKLLPHLKQHIEDILHAREVGNQLESKNPGYKADCVKADETKEQSFGGGSSSMHNSRKIVGETAPKDAFGSEEQCEVLMNDPNVESRSQRDDPIQPQSDSTKKEIRPPRAGEADEPELLADPSSSKTKKKKKTTLSSKSKKHKKRAPSLDEETSDDRQSESSSGDERLADPSPSKTKKKKKKKFSSTSKRRRRTPSPAKETSNDEGSESSSDDERRRRTKRGKRRKRKRSESSSSESSDSDRHIRRRNKHKHSRASSPEFDARGSGSRHRHHRPRRHRSVSSSD